MATPSSPSLIKKPQPIPWAHQETTNLIQAYQEKWYSLGRGQLKASQWEEVAVTVGARCGYDHSNPSVKSGKQCRHKIEKLRKRYRTEKERGGGMFSWPYFDLMMSLEQGPLPISVCPLEEEEEDDDDNTYQTNCNYNPLREDDDDGDCFINKSKTKGDEAGTRLAAEIREFTTRFVRMGKRKIEMMRESERWRTEMENKRIQMIVDSETKILDIIATTFQD